MAWPAELVSWEPVGGEGRVLSRHHRIIHPVLVTSRVSERRARECVRMYFVELSRS